METDNLMGLFGKCLAPMGGETTCGSFKPLTQGQPHLLYILIFVFNFVIYILLGVVLNPQVIAQIPLITLPITYNNVHGQEFLHVNTKIIYI